jgi:hypothetical protein
MSDIPPWADDCQPVLNSNTQAIAFNCPANTLRMSQEKAGNLGPPKGPHRASLLCTACKRCGGWATEGMVNAFQVSP